MITVSKIQSLTIKNVPTEKCLKNIQNKMVMHIKKKNIVTFGSQYQKLKHLQLKMSELKKYKKKYSKQHGHVKMIVTLVMHTKKKKFVIFG